MSEQSPAGRARQPDWRATVSGTPEAWQRRREAEDREYGEWIAAEAIDHGNARAYNPGDPIPASNVAAWGYDQGEAPAAVRRDSATGRRVLREVAGLPPEQMPAAGATKAAWVAYATSQGMPEPDADARTKDQLVAYYTGQEG